MRAHDLFDLVPRQMARVVVQRCHLDEEVI